MICRAAITSLFLRFVLILKVCVFENIFVLISKKCPYFDLCPYFCPYFCFVVRVVLMQWMNIFATNDSFLLLHKLISIVFSMPVSVWNVCSPCSPCGACVLPFVEHVFSLVSAQWSKERNSVSEKTVKSILQVKVNLEASCGEMQQILCKNKELLDQILSSAKYN